MPLAQSLSTRVLSRLISAEAQEPDPWLRDDLQIAKLTVVHAARGDAVECSPYVLATYEVLGLHPEKVWPAIQARSKALGPLCENVSAAPPKKPAQSIKLWSKKTTGARAVNTRAGEIVLHGPRLLPMATASIAALYPNPDAPSSPKTRGFSYDEMLAIVEFSGAPHSVRHGTLSALKARGRLPNEDGPATGIVCISLIGMMLHGVCCRSTARWRARRAVKLGYWRQVRPANSWSNCPKCGAQRTTGACDKCDYVGRSKTPEGKANFDEFSRPYVYEIDIEKFRTAKRCRELRNIVARTYDEYKESVGIHAMPARRPATPAPPPPAPAAPVRQATAEHAHRNPVHAASVVGGTAVSDRATQLAQRLFEVCGLADLGAIPQIAISLVSEANYLGVEIEEAAKSVADCAVRDQKNGVTLTRFYFRDVKWRTSNGGQQTAAQGRAERSTQQIAEALRRFNRNPEDDCSSDPFDGVEFKE